MIRSVLLTALVLFAAATPLCAEESRLGEAVSVGMETAAGTITFEIYPEAAPESSRSFLQYVDDGLYEGAHFYRVVRADNDESEFKIEVIQGGLDWDSLPETGVTHETTQQTGILHTDGTLSLARGAPGTGSGAAFFITIGDQPSLDFGGARNPDGQGFAAFGRVTQGMDVVRDIQARDTHDAAEAEYVQGQMLSFPVKIIRTWRVD